MRILFTIILCIYFGSVHAQGHFQDREKLDSAKTVFINQRLLLTSVQAQKFWPAYNEYSAKRKEFRKSQKKLRDEQVNINATDEQLKASLKEILKIKKEELALEEEFQNQILGILSVRQVVALKNAEHEFMSLLRKRIQPGRDRSR